MQITRGQFTADGEQHRHAAKHHGGCERAKSNVDFTIETALAVYLARLSTTLATMGDQTTQLSPRDRITSVDHQIHRLIMRVARAQVLPVAAPWAGTSVLICAPGQDWSDPPNTSAYSSDGVTWVVTEYVEQLSWCFLQLQNILSPGMDYIGSQDVFSHLAEAAIDFLGRSSAGELDFHPDARGKALLLFVLQCARRLINNPS